MIDLENEKVLIGKDAMEDVVTQGQNFLLMKLLSIRYHNREALKTTMTKV